MSVAYFVFASMHCKWFKKNHKKQKTFSCHLLMISETIKYWFNLFSLYCLSQPIWQLTLLKSKLNIWIFHANLFILLTAYVNMYPKEDFIRRSDKKSSGSLMIRNFSDRICTLSCASAVRFINIDDVWSFLYDPLKICIGKKYDADKPAVSSNPEDVCFPTEAE